MLTINESKIISESVSNIAGSWAMTQETRCEVARVASASILSERGLIMASEDADVIISEIREVLGLSSHRDVRLTHGALGK